VNDNKRQALLELESLYEALDERLSRTGACQRCGRCCQFGTFGHMLYASYLEALYLVTRDGAPKNAFSNDACGYLERLSCTARRGRVLGCRVFFCEAAGGVDREGQERVIAAIKESTRRHGLEWQYRPLAQHLDNIDALISPEVQERQENETFFP